MNHSYKDQLSMIQSIKLNDGDNKTIDCPFCGTAKKFTIGKIDGKLLWNCYRASCTAGGVYSGPRTAEEIRNYLAGKRALTLTRKTTPLPTMTTSVDNHPAAVEYLKSVNSYDAVTEGLLKVRYAPADDRVVFYTQCLTGAVGRSLGKSQAKWWSFGNTTGGIHVGMGSTAVLVEDVASACSVSRLPEYTGVAMLGTSISKPLKTILNKYNKTIIVLDNDATSKAVSVSHALGRSSTTRITKTDLKWLNSNEIRKVLTL